MSRLHVQHAMRVLNRLLLLLGIIAVAAGWYLYRDEGVSTSQRELPVKACQITVTMSDGSEEPLAVPGCEAHYRAQQP